MAFYDSEGETMNCARRCRAKQSHGFQGCKNYPKTCSFGGFYLCTYSPEGLCDNCELKQFPERFQGCMFCRRPQAYGGSCLTCRATGGWINTQFTKDRKVDFDYQQTLDQAIFRLTRNHEVKFPFVDPKVFATLDFVEHGKFPKKWPGFFTGYDENNRPTWDSNPPFDSTKIEIPDMTWDNCEVILKRELEKQGIFIHQEIQVKRRVPIVEFIQEENNEHFTKCLIEGMD